MDEHQLEAYRLMIKALGLALNEIHNPGSNRASGLNIVEHIEQVIQQAYDVAPELL